MASISKVVVSTEYARLYAWLLEWEQYDAKRQVLQTLNIQARLGHRINNVVNSAGFITQCCISLISTSQNKYSWCLSAFRERNSWWVILIFNHQLQCWSAGLKVLHVCLQFTYSHFLIIHIQLLASFHDCIT